MRHFLSLFFSPWRRGGFGGSMLWEIRSCRAIPCLGVICWKMTDDGSVLKLKHNLLSRGYHHGNSFFVLLNWAAQYVLKKNGTHLPSVVCSRCLSSLPLLSARSAISSLQGAFARFKAKSKTLVHVTPQTMGCQCCPCLPSKSILEDNWYILQRGLRFMLISTLVPELAKKSRRLLQPYKNTYMETKKSQTFLYEC